MATTIRQGTLADVEAAIAIQRVCLEAPHWGVEQYIGIVHSQRDSLQRRVLLISEEQERIVGFVVVSAVAGQAEIESVAVLPEVRRQGIGRSLCEAAMTWASQCGASEMLLEVRSANAAAQAMYARLGFTQTGLRKDYYTNPSDSAVLMASNLLLQRNL